MTLYALRDDSCVLHLPMNEGEGSVVYDHSRYGNNGQIVGANWTQGKFGKALSFDGSDDYVGVPDSASLKFGEDSFSITLWLKMAEEQPASYPHFISKWSGSIGFFAFPTEGEGCNIRVRVNSAVKTFQNTQLDDYKWHFITIVVERDVAEKVYVYKDAVKSSTELDISEVGSVDNTNSLLISKVDGFAGTMDEVRIYNRALSEEEIKSLYLYYQNFEVRPCILCPRPII